MRHAVIMAGGKGTRLWPMSVKNRPKQLIPFVGGRHLLGIAYDRLERLVDTGRRYICAGNIHREAILNGIPGLSPERFLGEPEGRDTLAALGYSAAVISAEDPDAVIAVFTADHIIEPVDRFREIIEYGYGLVESGGDILVTFGITPSYGATGYGYLELGRPVAEAVPGQRDSAEAGGATSPSDRRGARLLTRFKEKPDAETAEVYFAAGQERYLWNSGMFIWRADTFLECIRRYEPELHRGILRIAAARGGAAFEETLAGVYPTLKKTSVDFGVMEPASQDGSVRVVAVPMDLTWLDIGSWTAYSELCDTDDRDNAVAQGEACLVDSSSNLIVGERDHLIAGIGLQEMIIIHTPQVTLVCPKGRDQDIKRLYDAVAGRFEDEYL